MSSIPQTNLKFGFKVEIFKDANRYKWKIFDHKNNVIGQSVNSFKTRDECEGDLTRLANSIKDFLKK